MTRNRLRYAVLAAAIFTSSLVAHAQTNVPQLGKDPIPQVIKAMTLEEKVQLLVGAGFALPGAASTPGTAIGQTLDRVAGAAGTTQGIKRLGIPSIVTADGPAGVRIDSVRKDHPGQTYYATGWPVATLLASSWDTTLVQNVGKAFGHEVKAYGVDVILGPGMNIHRNPLGGRNFEYYSEDPLVAGKMAAAIVNGIQSNGVGTSIKHFAANNQETNRNTVNTIVSERALREIYLKGFEIAVKQAKPWTVMSSYNLINGTYTSESPDLLNTILRKEWGYKGFVMTDWFGGKDAVAQMKAGNNLLMPGTPAQTKAIVDAVKSGQLSQAVLDENVAGMLQIILKSPSFLGLKATDKPDLKGDAQVARSAAAESMILLKNTLNALPIAKNVQRVAVFGNNGYKLIAGGTGSGDVNKAYTVSLVQGLGNAGYKVDTDLQQAYTGYLTDYAAKLPKKSFFEEFMNPTPPTPEYVLATDLITKKAAATDIAIIVIGRNAGENKDRILNDDYELSSIEQETLKRVADAYHAQKKKVIVVMNIGGVINVTPWRDEVDAILLAWQPGQEGGNAIADVLSGKVNPSGKLATTFSAAYADVPSAKTFPGKSFPERATTGFMGMKATPGEVTYEEGIYVGYRYFSTFNVKPAYEFGYGLSYTTFDYTNLKLSSASFEGSIKATVSIKNTGKVAGKEVVEAYLTAPTGKLDKPALELKGFAKTGLLQPGQSQSLTFTFSPADLASFDTASSSWIADAGKYTLKVGASSQNMKQTASFDLPKEIIVERDNKALVPQVQINELKKQ
jgi:beta-glucosidase